MATFYATVTRILDELNRTDLTAQAGAAIRSAIEFYSNEDWGFNETVTSQTVTSYSNDLPSDFRAEVFVGIDYQNRRYKACPISYDDWADGWDANSTGFPSHYTLWGSKIYLDPTPDRTYTLHLAYCHTLPDLSDSGTNGFITELEEVIRMRAEADLLLNVIRGPEASQEAAGKKAQEQIAYQRCKARRVRFVSSGIKRRGLL